MEYDLFPAWPDVAAHLIEVAAGRSFADTVIRKGQWVNVHTREVLAGYDIAIVKGRIACVVPDAGYCTGPDTEVIEADGRFMIPGLCDGHMHLSLIHI